MTGTGSKQQWRRASLCGQPSEAFLELGPGTPFHCCPRQPLHQHHTGREAHSSEAFGLSVRRCYHYPKYRAKQWKQKEVRAAAKQEGNACAGHQETPTAGAARPSSQRYMGTAICDDTCPLPSTSPRGKHATRNTPPDGRSEQEADTTGDKPPILTQACDACLGFHSCSACRSAESCDWQEGSVQETGHKCLSANRVSCSKSFFLYEVRCGELDLTPSSSGGI